MQTIDEALFANLKTRKKCSKQLTKYPFKGIRNNCDLRAQSSNDGCNLPNVIFSDIFLP
jgi:hypothetical protein